MGISGGSKSLFEVGYWCIKIQLTKTVMAQFLGKDPKAVCSQLVHILSPPLYFLWVWR
jgi:hypothetical protein